MTIHQPCLEVSVSVSTSHEVAAEGAGGGLPRAGVQLARRLPCASASPGALPYVAGFCFALGLTFVAAGASAQGKPAAEPSHPAAAPAAAANPGKDVPGTPAKAKPPTAEATTAAAEVSVTPGTAASATPPTEVVEATVAGDGSVHQGVEPSVDAAPAEDSLAAARDRARQARIAAAMSAADGQPAQLTAAPAPAAPAPEVAASQPPAPEPAPRSAPSELPWQIRVGGRALWNSTAGFDPFSDNGSMGQLELMVGYDVMHPTPRSALGVELAWAGGSTSRDGLLGGNLEEASLRQDDFALGLHLAHWVLPWLAPYVRAEVALSRVALEVSTRQDYTYGGEPQWVGSSGQYSEATWTPTASFGAGLSTDVGVHGAAIGVSMDAGYQVGGSASLRAGGGGGEVATTGADLGTLERHGPYLRCGAQVRF